MIRKVEVDPIVRPKSGRQMKVIAFLTDSAVMDRIINHPELMFISDRTPPPHLAYQQVLVATETTSS